MLSDNLTVNGNALYFDGRNVCELAAKYGTPLYLMDEDRIRARCREYRAAMRAAFGEKSAVLYAAKASAYKQMFRIMHEEGMHADVVSSGELYTALQAGFPAERLWFHSSNKTDEDLRLALQSNVGRIVADSMEELAALQRIAAKTGKVPEILLRLTPGIDPHTFEAVATGQVDSKFGFGIETGAAEEAVRFALSLSSVRLVGFHCHVGSQVFDSDVFLRSAKIMLAFMAEVRDTFGYVADVLDLGGGYGVRYLPSDPELHLSANIAEIGAFLLAECDRLAYPLPLIALEPGRSLVADAGLTVYTVGVVKPIPGVRTYVSVDGGMTDNIRHALYGAPYTVLPASRMDEPPAMRATVVGRCCESGDVIQPDVPLPGTLQRGDLLAVCTTGAYHYSMASNYNRLPRPPIVMLRNGDDYLAVRRETLDDLLQCDL
ncbi:MAG: diaminopimelate decarboxylase [Clostridia bacterium]|nr:diaminopimelate decarboxylase [Clostridia bacterium]